MVYGKSLGRNLAGRQTGGAVLTLAMVGGSNNRGVHIQETAGMRYTTFATLTFLLYQAPVPPGEQDQVLEEERNGGRVR